MEIQLENFSRVESYLEFIWRFLKMLLKLISYFPKYDVMCLGVLNVDVLWFSAFDSMLVSSCYYCGSFAGFGCWFSSSAACGCGVSLFATFGIFV